jgi:hypothetical protein
LAFVSFRADPRVAVWYRGETAHLNRGAGLPQISLVTFRANLRRSESWSAVFRARRPHVQTLDFRRGPTLMEFSTFLLHPLRDGLGEVTTHKAIG